MDDSLSPDDKAFFDAVIAAGPAGLAVSAGRVVARDDGAYDLILDPDVLFAGTVGGFLDAMGAPDVDGGDLGNYGADSPAGRDVFPVHTRNGKADGPWDYGDDARHGLPRLQGHAVHGEPAVRDVLVVMTISNRVGAAGLAIVFVAFVFLAGFNVGEHQRGCAVIVANAAAFKSDPAYWGSSMRTLVESCERGF